MTEKHDRIMDTMGKMSRFLINADFEPTDFMFVDTNNELALFVFGDRKHPLMKKYQGTLKVYPLEVEIDNE